MAMNIEQADQIRGMLKEEIESTKAEMIKEAKEHTEELMKTKGLVTKMKKEKDVARLYKIKTAELRYTQAYERNLKPFYIRLVLGQRTHIQKPDNTSFGR